MVVNHRALNAGERIELRRRRLGLSRRVVAQLAGRSEEWLRQIERGHRRLDSIEMVYRLAEVLRFDDPVDLIGWPSSSISRAREIGEMGLQLTALNRAIMDHPSTQAFATTTMDSPPPLATVREALEECWRSWLGSSHRYTEIATRLPEVLAAARSIRAAAQATSDEQLEEAGRVLAEAYHLARFVLARVGNHHLAWLVADRPIGILTPPAQPTLVAVSSWHVASALLALGYPAESRDYALAAARRLATATPAQAEGPVYGALQLLAAEGASSANDLEQSERLATEAAGIAERLDAENHVRTVWFGVPEVAITGMDIALRLGRVDDAIKLAADVHLPDDASVDLLARYYLTTAYAYGRKGEDFAAILALQGAERASPEDLRYDWMAHRTLQRLARHDHHLTRRDLAKLLAVAGLA
ncbi:helix-turn-helix domain-containing protein [Nocardia sp. XZ_19_369]|uniref:helix-turn-helix domain-containing protein n=1 Tax=Nocardia sp. XZ_19_369 TaxID=2769487 RepID=UPI00188F9B46|nr:helix-turn-helix domain-containing protein [Nocardia sp. XZ_19_369]